MSWRPAPGSQAPEVQPHHVRETLDRVVNGLAGGGVRASTLDRVFSRWEELVGPQVAAHARPLSMRGSTLVVGVDESAWATQLRMLSGSLLGRIADGGEPDEVVAIEVRVRP